MRKWFGMFFAVAIALVATVSPGRADEHPYCDNSSPACRKLLEKAGCLTIHRRFADPRHCRLWQKGCARARRTFAWVCAEWPQ